MAAEAPGTTESLRVHLDQTAGKGYTEEVVMVGQALLQDFEKNGIHLEDRKQGELAELAQRCHTLGMAFGTDDIPC